MDQFLMEEFLGVCQLTTVSIANNPHRFKFRINYSLLIGLNSIEFTPWFMRKLKTGVPLSHFDTTHFFQLKWLMVQMVTVSYLC